MTVSGFVDVSCNRCGAGMGRKPYGLAHKYETIWCAGCNDVVHRNNLTVAEHRAIHARTPNEDQVHSH